MVESLRDPIVDEIHEVRESLAARHGGDVRAIVQELRSKQAEGCRDYVSLPPKSPPSSVRTDAEGAA